MSAENFFSRWSRKKAASTAGPARPTADAVPAQATSTAGPDRPTADVVPAQAGTQSPLPPIESLTPESDFAPFMQPDVDAATKRSALKVLLSDPRFNVMDGLDVYIDDYSRPDPLPAGWLEKMNQVARLGIFAEPRDEPREPPAEGAPALQKAAEEQRLAAAAGSAPLDTSNADIPALKSAESSSSG